MKLLISDWEGTLVDFQWNLKKAIEEIWKVLEKYIETYELSFPLYLKNYDYANIYNYIQKNITNRKLKEKIITEFDKIYDKYDNDAACRWELKKEVIPMLEKLKENRVKIALCSNVGRKALNNMLEKFNLKPFFDITISRNEVSYLKPNIEGVKKILNFYNVNVENNQKDKRIFFLGDSVTDITTAKKAKIQSIIVIDSSENSFEDIYKNNPDHIINNVKNLVLFF